MTGAAFEHSVANLLKRNVQCGLIVGVIMMCCVSVVRTRISEEVVKKGLAVLCKNEK